MNGDGTSKEYGKPEGYHIEDNKVLIDRTGYGEDVKDWVNKPMVTFMNSKTYKIADKALRAGPRINMVIGHSSGGMASLQLEKDYPDRHVPLVTYPSPVFC